MRARVRLFFVGLVMATALGLESSSSAQPVGPAYFVLRGDDLLACTPRSAVDRSVRPPMCCWGVVMYYRFEQWDDSQRRWVYVLGHEPGGQGPTAGRDAEQRWTHVQGRPDGEDCETVADVSTLPPGRYRLVPLGAMLAQQRTSFPLRQTEINFAR